MHVLDILPLIQVRKEIDRLLPQFEELKEKEEQRKRLAASRETLGVSQAFELGKRSNEEYEIICLNFLSINLFFVGVQDLTVSRMKY